MAYCFCSLCGIDGCAGCCSCANPRTRLADLPPLDLAQADWKEQYRRRLAAFAHATEEERAADLRALEAEA